MAENCVKFMSENYADTLILAAKSISSVDSAFPLTYAFQPRRSKQVHTAGFFTVGSGATDNKIVFQEDGITDLTATITAGDYSGDAAFFAAVKSAMEAVSTNGITVTVARDADNNKITITSDGAGSSTFDLIWTDANSAGMASIMGFDTSSDQSGSLTYTADLLRIHTSEYLLLDFGISSNPQAFAMTMGGRNELSTLSPSATIRLEGSHTNNFTSPDYSQAITHRDSIFYLFANDGLHTEALRFWRVYFEDVDNSQGYLTIAAIFLGNPMLKNSRGSVQFPFSGDHIDNSNTVQADGGETFSEVKQKTWGRQVEWFAVTKEEKEEIDDFFDDYGTSKPFFVAFDADNFFSTADREILYAKFKSPPRFTLASPNNYRVQFDVVEEI